MTRLQCARGVWSGGVRRVCGRCACGVSAPGLRRVRGPRFRQARLTRVGVQCLALAKGLPLEAIAKSEERIPNDRKRIRRSPRSLLHVQSRSSSPPTTTMEANFLEGT